MSAIRTYNVEAGLPILDEARRLVIGEIKRAKSHIEEVRALTSERVALYRQTNTRFRQLLAPPSFRKSPEYPELKWWREVSMSNSDGRPHAG